MISNLQWKRDIFLELIIFDENTKRHKLRPLKSSKKALCTHIACQHSAIFAQYIITDKCIQAHAANCAHKTRLRSNEYSS